MRGNSLLAAAHCLCRRHHNGNVQGPIKVVLPQDRSFGQVVKQQEGEVLQRPGREPIVAHPHELPSIAHRLEISRDKQEQSCDPKLQPQVEEPVVGMASDKSQPGRDPRRFTVEPGPKTAEPVPQRHVAGDGSPRRAPDLRSPGEGHIAAEGGQQERAVAGGQ